MTPSDLAALCAELATQDNNGDSDPLFVVEERRRVYGVDPSWTDRFCYMDADGNGFATLEEMRGYCDDNGITHHEDIDAERVGYVDRWHAVSFHLTRQAAEDWREQQKHNYPDTRLFAYSLRHCPELRDLRRAILTGRVEVSG